MNKRRGKPKGKGKPSINDDERDLTTSSESIEEHDDGIFVVRKISGSTSNLSLIHISEPTRRS